MSWERRWLEMSERGEPFAAGGCLLVAQAQRVSVLACTQPLAMVISYSTADREECGTAPLAPKAMPAHTDTRGLRQCSRLLEAAEGWSSLFLILHQPSMAQEWKPQLPWAQCLAPRINMINLSQ